MGVVCNYRVVPCTQILPCPTSPPYGTAPGHLGTELVLPAVSGWGSIAWEDQDRQLYLKYLRLPDMHN